MTPQFTPEQRSRLANTIRNAYESASTERKERAQYINIYEGSTSFLEAILGDRFRGRRETLVNYFQMFVRGKMTVLAATSPRWAVRSRTSAGRGFDRRIQAFLNRYTEVLNLHATFKACALDSSFGRCVMKVVTSIAPKGVTAPYAPRAFRINPDNFFVDRSTLSPILDEATFMGDLYLVSLEAAKEFPGFDEKQRQELVPYRLTSGDYPLPTGESSSDRDLFAEDMVRLVDVYFPAMGILATWQCRQDTFADIASNEPLAVQQVPVNPYVEYSSVQIPNSLREYAPLKAIKELHFLANDMLHKAADQARASKRNPIGSMGTEDDMMHLLDAADNEPVFVEDKNQIDMYEFPGPDQSIIGMGNLAGSLLSQVSGNLEVALGLSAGAPTARQTQSIVNQFQSVQAIDRFGFEKFMAEVAKRLASLAFQDDMLNLEVLEQVPGTNYMVNSDWLTPDMLPRVGEVDDYFFEVVPYSSGYRTPAERIDQLNQASGIVMNWMMAATQGAPINMEAVISDVAESYDLVGDLQSWWSGQPPTPMEKTANTYMSTAGPAEGSTISYETNSPAGPMGGPMGVESGSGGLRSAM